MVKGVIAVEQLYIMGGIDFASFVFFCYLALDVGEGAGSAEDEGGDGCDFLDG
jgi:hypothetical protein